jgi:hypothetical protein
MKWFLQNPIQERPFEAQTSFAVIFKRYKFHSRKTLYFSYLKYIFVFFTLNIKLHNYTRFYVPSCADIFKIYILATFHK